MPENITKNIFKKYAGNIIVTILASILFVFCILPFLIKLNFSKDYLFEVTFESVTGIICVIVIFIILFWSKAKRFCQRYRNTCKLSEPPLVYPDYIFIFIFLSCLLILLFQQDLVLKTPLAFRSFLAFNIFLLVGVLFICFAKYKKKENASVTSDTISHSDEPIKLAEQDILGREKFVDDLYKEISCLVIDDSFVFGIHGKWGEGKTSIIHLLEEKFEHNKDFIIVNYDPWYFNNEKAIMSAFYGGIERAINKEFIFPSLKKAFIKYQKIVSSGLSLTGIKINPFLCEESIEEVKQRIESYIEQIEKKLLIIIDDIDRLQPDEILLIFKLVRLNTKFKNTIFLLSFDQIVIQNVLKNNTKTDPSFLEKIVQKPVTLPAIEQCKIDEFIISRQNKLFDEINVPNDQKLKIEKDFSYLYRTQIRKLFKTLRDAKRYLNGLRTTLPPIKTEVCLYDFCILEIIRIFYHNVYNDIWNNPSFYIPISLGTWRDFPSAPFPYSDNKDIKYTLIEKHIKKIFENEKESIILKELLETIFFIEVKCAFSKHRTTYSSDYINENRAEKRITHPESFRKYFMLKVPLSEISDEFMETTLEFWNLTEKSDKECVIEKKIYEIKKKGKLSEFFNKLTIFINIIDVETTLEIIRANYKSVENIIEEEDSFSKYHDVAYLLLSLINDKIDKDKIQLTIEEVITGTPLLPFAVYFVMYCRREGTGIHYNIYSSLENNKIRDLVSNRLKKYFIDEKRDIFDELVGFDLGFVLYQWSSNWNTFTGDNKKTVNKYLQTLFKDNCKKFTKLIMRMRERSPLGNDWLFNFAKFGNVYDLKEFKKLASKFQDDKSLTPEEKEAIQLFIKTPYETDEVAIQKQNAGKEETKAESEADEKEAKAEEKG